MVKKIFVILACLILSFGYYTAILNAGAEVDKDVKAFLDNLEDAIYKMDTYRCVMLSEVWKGKRHEKKIIKFRFKKPNLMRTDVLEGRKKGSAVVLNKKGKIRGKNTWGLKRTLKPTDKRIRNIRGSTFLNASLLNKMERLKEHILERGCKATLTEEEYAGRPSYHLHIDHEGFDNPVTAEDIWFNKENFFILKNLKYEGKTKVSDTTWRDFEINIPLVDSLFEM